MTNLQDALMIIGEMAIVQRQLEREIQELKQQLVEMADPFATKQQEPSHVDKRE